MAKRQCGCEVSELRTTEEWREGESPATLNIRPCSVHAPLYRNAPNLLAALERAAAKMESIYSRKGHVTLDDIHDVRTAIKAAKGGPK
jgi:hypothetical protein